VCVPLKSRSFIGFTYLHVRFRCPVNFSPCILSWFTLLSTFVQEGALALRVRNLLEVKFCLIDPETYIVELRVIAEEGQKPFKISAYFISDSHGKLYLLRRLHFSGRSISRRHISTPRASKLRVTVPNIRQKLAVRKMGGSDTLKMHSLAGGISSFGNETERLDRPDSEQPKTCV
jgi:hypothetical protein